MDILSILSFLLPVHLSPFELDFLPLIFFIIIWFLFGWTIYRVYTQAKTDNWENNWYGGNKKDKGKKLDAEHGSVMEISEAVATSSEKLADIMPGMILIIGLLGTFLGLGLALDKASSILTGANAMSNMDASMAQLMGMLEGLGTKFKTSTWGLLAFILLKVILSKNGYEERRLRWSIEKVKSELDLVRDQQLQEDRANNQKIIDSMLMVAKQFEESLQINQSSNREQLRQLIYANQDITSVIRKGQESEEKILQALEENQNSHSKMVKQQALSFERVLENLCEKYEQTIINLSHYHQENRTLQNTLFDKLATNLSYQNNQLLEGLNSHHQEHTTFLADIVSQGKDTRDAMVGFIEKNEATVNVLAQSAKGMSQAASDMGKSASHLQTVINSFRSNMETVVDLMKKDLNSTIKGMNDSFSKNMSEMSEGLNTATKDISHAVNNLSVSVDETMKNVTNTIDESMKLQKQAQSAFIESTDTLNEYVNEMKNLVEKLQGDITGGLKAVSESNRHVINLAKKLDNILESLESIDALKELKPTLDNLASSIQLQKDALQNMSIQRNQQNRKNKDGRNGSPISTKAWLLGNKNGGGTNEG